MNTNYIYVDESGDPKNSKVFIICFIVFKNIHDVYKTSKNIENFKNERFKNEEVEIHFNKESFQLKKSFFKMLSTENKFIIKFYQMKIKNKNISYNEHIFNSLLENRDIIQNSTIHIDGYIPKTYKKFIVSKIKKELKLNNINIKSIKYIDSKNSSPIQLADMCAGCIRRKLERNTLQDNELYELIEKFIIP